MKHAVKLLTFILLAPLAALHAEPETRPTVGAIRWDAWYGEGRTTKAVEASLGQPKYHFRLPWFARVLGADKVSAYACGGSYSMTQPSYAEQCALIRRDRWEKCRALRIPSVTFASAGWDTRPRNERPPAWCTWVTATPDKTPPAQQKPLVDSVTATPDELAAHIREAVEWTKANRDLNPANAIIIYGWNENDEGGWLQPTLRPDGQPDESRVKALGQILRPSSPEKLR